MLIPNTFGLEAEARELVVFQSVEELKRVLAAHRGERVLVVGQGSNLLLRGDFDGLVLQSGMTRVLSLTEDDDYVYIDCGAGIVLDELIAQVADMGLWGLENLSYIPGTVGASAVQNVGAYGVEAKDVITSVHTVEIATGAERIRSVEECGYGYRESVFKVAEAGKYVVTSVTYKLGKTPHPPKGGGVNGSRIQTEGKTPMQIREEIIATRRKKLPEVSEYGSAGSFFKNPKIPHPPVEGEVNIQELLQKYPDMPHWAEPDGMVKLSAAWLIDQCGLKGLQIGGARVWDKQPLVLVNYTGKATAEEIMALAEKVVTSVKEKFGVTLIPEVEYV